MSDRQQPPSSEGENWGPETPWQEPLLPPPTTPPPRTASARPPQPEAPPAQPPTSQPGWERDQWGMTAPGRMPETYLAGAILVTLFCFLPTGIAAIVFSSQVSEKWKAGDVVGSAESSRKARLWMIVSLVVGCIAWLFFIAVGMAADPNTTSMPAP